MAKAGAHGQAGASGGPAHVVITGASSGLGAALADCYAARGASLTLIGRDAIRLEVTRAACAGRAALAVGLVCDVTDANALRAALASAEARQPVDLVIANAGVGGAGVLAPRAGESAALARDIMDVNFMGVVHTVTPLIAPFIARGRGQIAIVSSLAGLDGLADSPVYCASKAAARVYGHGLRRLLGPRGIRVSVVLPGFVATPMSASLPLRQPFTVEVGAAARRIVEGLDRGRAEIAFPWQWRLVAHVLTQLPRGVSDRILAAGRRRLERHEQAARRDAGLETHD